MTLVLADGARVDVPHAVLHLFTDARRQTGWGGQLDLPTDQRGFEEDFAVRVPGQHQAQATVRADTGMALTARTARRYYEIVGLDGEAPPFG